MTKELLDSVNDHKVIKRGRLSDFKSGASRRHPCADGTLVPFLSIFLSGSFLTSGASASVVRGLPKLLPLKMLKMTHRVHENAHVVLALQVPPSCPQVGLWTQCSFNIYGNRLHITCCLLKRVPKMRAPDHVLPFISSSNDSSLGSLLEFFARQASLWQASGHGRHRQSLTLRCRARLRTRWRRLMLSSWSRPESSWWPRALTCPPPLRYTLLTG